MLITNALQYFAALLVISLGVFWAYKKFPNKVFKWVPSVLVIFFIVVLCNTFGVWSFKEAAISGARSNYLKYVIPFMIFLISVQADLKKLAKVGPKMLSVMFLTSVSIVIGMVVAYFVWAQPLGLTNAPQSFGAWTGAYVGGVENLYAVADANHLSADEQANVLLLINISFRPWMTLLMVMVPLAAKFNQWTKADTSAIDHLAAGIDEIAGEKVTRSMNNLDLFTIFGIGLAVVAVGFTVGDMLFALIPGVPAEVWRYVIVTVAGVLLGTYTNIAKTPGLEVIGSFLAAYTLSVSCSNTDLKTFLNAGTYLLAALTVLGIHTVFMFLMAKLMKLDLFTLGIASIANIGGVSSTPVVAACYGTSYQTVGVLMAAMGSMYGTFFGLAVTAILSTIG